MLDAQVGAVVDTKPGVLLKTTTASPALEGLGASLGAG
jgi:hypothetical protein